MQSRGPVVITGASTGIGRACALHLAERGHRVFAGVRNEADAASIRREGLDALSPVTIDVTKPATIAAAASQVEEALDGEPLAGLVNNAGVGVGGPLEYLSLDRVRWQFEVNVFGLLAVTQGFLPMLRARPGRVVNIGSIAGRVTTPFMGPYCASKHAVEALTDSLRGELKPWGIHASVIEPGRVETPIWDKASATAQEISDALPPEAQDLYGPSLTALDTNLTQGREGAVPARRVARAVEKALTSRRPRTRYPVGPDAWAGTFFSWILPRGAFEWLYRKALRLP